MKSTPYSSLSDGTEYNGRTKEYLKIGVDALPGFAKDNTDRNRTSPFAFTGNKFEFRMLGSSLSISGPNIVLNTIVAEALKQFADVLEGAEDLNSALDELIRDTIKKHKRIIFNDNGYDQAWVEEAERRGLLNLKSTPDCLPLFLSKKNIDLFTSHGVFSEKEMRSRYEIVLENYCKVLNIEVLTMLEMAMQNILPAACAYAKELSETARAKKTFLADADCSYEEELVGRISGLTAALYGKVKSLKEVLGQTGGIEDVAQLAKHYSGKVIPAMNELRSAADELEKITAKEYWPYPGYGDLLFSMR